LEWPFVTQRVGKKNGKREGGKVKNSSFPTGRKKKGKEKGGIFE